MAGSFSRRGDGVLSAQGDEAAREKRGRGNRAFAIWLERGLHQLYDGIAGEPIPDDLLKLIESDRDDRKRE